MKITCQFSGLEFRTDGFTRSTNIKGHHPIFDLDQRELLLLTPRWSAKSFSYISAAGWDDKKQTQYIAECRLLFLALLRSTELIHFYVPAVPSHVTVQRNMERLIKFINWQNISGIAHKLLPQYAIKPDNADLHNIQNYFESWGNTKETWEEKHRQEVIGRRLRDKEVQLLRLINSGLIRQPNVYALKLAEWAMDAGRVPEKLRGEWTRVFMLRDFIDIINTDKKLIETIQKFMLARLDAGTVYASAVNRLLAKIADDNNLKSSIGGDLSDEDIADLKSAAEEWNGGPRILSTDPSVVIEQHNRKAIAASAPTQEPVRSHYKTNFEYLRAKSAWTIFLAEKEKDAKLVEREIERTRRENLDIITSEEVINEDVDPRQLGLDIFKIIKDDDADEKDAAQ